MIITRTPHRISLVGGGSDLPAWCDHRPGAVLGFALARYCYVFLRDLPPYAQGYRHRIVWSRIELVNAIDEIQHPAVRVILSEHAPHNGIEVHHASDLPAKAGLGSSSSFTVGLLYALDAYARRYRSTAELAQEAIRLEQNVMKEAVGSQDQLFAAHGGFRLIRFGPEGYRVLPALFSPKVERHLLDHLILFFTDTQRFAIEVEAEKIRTLDDHVPAMTRLVSLVDEAYDAIATKDIEAFANVLHESWDLKRSLSDAVSSPNLDAIYDLALRNGAMGGKLLGAGGGGCFLFVVRPERRDHLKRALGLLEIPITIDREGSRVVHHAEDE